MNESPTTGRSTWKHQLRGLASEFGRTIQLRRDLAAVELAHDRKLLVRAAIRGSIGAVMMVTGLPLLLQAAARQLASITTLGITAWSVILGSVIVVPGTLLLALAIRKTRSDFYGLRGTLAELNEDLIWLREWTQSEDDAADA